MRGGPYREVALTVEGPLSPSTHRKGRLLAVTPAARVSVGAL